MRAAHGGRFWWVSLFSVHWLQGVLLFLIAFPVMVAAGAGPGSAAAPLVAGGAVLWAEGFLFEAVGDSQLARFKADPGNRGRVMDQGLWRFTRHPNYFGDALLWWGYFGFAAAEGAWWTAFGPLLMTVLLMKVSGVALLERTLRESKTVPGLRAANQRSFAAVRRSRLFLSKVEVGPALFQNPGGLQSGNRRPKMSTGPSPGRLRNIATPALSRGYRTEFA
jgi:steroid 5-alpha reductase family enzyme